jgi:hypothetical protein
MESRTSRGEPGRVGWLRRIVRRVSGLVRRVAELLRGPLRPVMLRWIVERIPAPLRWLGKLAVPDGERSFGSRWLIVTLAIAAALGLIVALLLSPVAALIALLVAAVWTLVHHARRAQERGTERSSESRLAGPAMRSMPEAAASSMVNR